MAARQIGCRGGRATDIPVMEFRSVVSSENLVVSTLATAVAADVTRCCSLYIHGGRPFIKGRCHDGGVA